MEGCDLAYESISHFYIDGYKAAAISSNNNRVIGNYTRLIPEHPHAISGTWKTGYMNQKGYGQVTFATVPGASFAYVVADCIDEDDGETELSPAGIEIIFYEWDANTGEIQLTLNHDTNGECGFFDEGVTDITRIERNGPNIVLHGIEEEGPFEVTLEGVF